MEDWKDDGKARVTAAIERHVEFDEFLRKLVSTGIRQHLSDEAVMLLFLALGRKMWRQ